MLERCPPAYRVEVMRRQLVRAMLVWAVLSVVGVIVVAVPDESARIFTLSETHGPSMPDLIGVVLLLLGWAVFLFALWRVRWAVRLPPQPTALAAVVATGVLAWSVLTDSGMWWLMAAGVLLGIQIWAGLAAVTGLEQDRTGDGR